MRTCSVEGNLVCTEGRFHSNFRMGDDNYYYIINILFSIVWGFLVDRKWCVSMCIVESSRINVLYGVRTWITKHKWFKVAGAHVWVEQVLSKTKQSSLPFPNHILVFSWTNYRVRNWVTLLIQLRFNTRFLPKVSFQ